MDKSLAIIGRTELVSFPKLGMHDIIAKIDTGADGSSIWATEIVEQDGLLSFVLFGPTSPHYTGERISTKEYTLTTVKNSFGVSAMRYKVMLSLSLGGKLIRAQFSLADRARNRYPILIGNASIRNKFLVDVKATRHITHGHKTSIMMLASDNKVAGVNKLVEGLREHLDGQASIVSSCYTDLRYDILDGVVRIADTQSGQDIADFDLVYFKTYFKYSELAAAVAEYLVARNIWFMDEEVATYHAFSKLTQYVKLALAGLPVPNSVFASPGNLDYDDIVAKLGKPFILKDIYADKGKLNHLVNSKTEFEATIAEGPHVSYIAQQFIPNSGDLRVLVLDTKPALVINRQATEGTHLNNTSVGGRAALLPLDAIDSAAKAMAVRAAVVMNRQVAGVDIVIDSRTNKWYILEVNNSPQISTGAFVDEKMAAFAKFLKRYTKK